jgi:hypothetical protein
MELPFQWPAEALKSFPIMCANSKVAEFSHHLIYVGDIWFGLNKKSRIYCIKYEMIIGSSASHI